MGKITGFIVAKNGFGAIFKSPAILIQVEPNKLEAVAYFRKPKHLSDAQFKAVIEDIASQIKGLSKDTIALLEEQ